MKKNERQRYPIFSAYAGTQAFIGSADRGEGLPFEDRVKSIWPFLVRRCSSFHASLKPREKTNYDPEDILSEVWVALAEKDHKWEPSRGKYITYAGAIMDREFSSIRDKARTVEAPRNSAGRLKRYVADALDGTISGQRARTADALKRTSDGTITISPARAGRGNDDHGVDPVDHRVTGPAATIENRERSARNRAAIMDAVQVLSTVESIVICRIAGIGFDPQPVWYIAWATCRSSAEVRRHRDSGTAKIKAYLSSVGHPAILDWASVGMDPDA